MHDDLVQLSILQEHQLYHVCKERQLHSTSTEGWWTGGCRVCRSRYGTLGAAESLPAQVSQPAPGPRRLFPLPAAALTLADSSSAPGLLVAIKGVFSSPGPLNVALGKGCLQKLRILRRSSWIVQAGPESQDKSVCE